VAHNFKASRKHHQYLDAVWNLQLKKITKMMIKNVTKEDMVKQNNLFNISAQTLNFSMYQSPHEVTLWSIQPWQCLQYISVKLHKTTRP
jgi:uncharacterized membrane protein (DUF2068 family)